MAKTPKATMVKKVRENDDSQPLIKAIFGNTTGATWKPTANSTTTENKNMVNDHKNDHDHEIQANKDGNLMIMSISKTKKEKWRPQNMQE